MRGVAPVVLNLSLVMRDLLFHMRGGSGERCQHVGIVVGGDELAVVLGSCDNLDLQLSVVPPVKIDGDLDHRETVEEVEELFRLLLELLLGGIVQVPVAGRDFHLHGRPRYW